MRTHLTYYHPRLPLLSRQRGAALFIALVALVSMTLAGLALVRSVDTANLIAGNFAMRQMTLHAADVGLSLALSELKAMKSEKLDSNNCSTGICTYYRLQLKNMEDASCTVSNKAKYPAGVPCLAWDSVPTSSTKVFNSEDFKIKYVIDRLCNQATPAGQPVLHIDSTCLAEVGIPHFRLTVSVEGPRNAVSFVQAIYRR